LAVLILQQSNEEREDLDVGIVGVVLLDKASQFGIGLLAHGERKKVLLEGGVEELRTAALRS